MIWLFIKRTIKSGLINFWRNAWVSLATILVMVITLFVIGGLIFSNVLLTSVLAQIEDKVDITAYFKTDVPESEILSLQESLLKLDEVEKVEYISREEALKQFKQRHINNALITQSLEELDENPLGASLNIKAKQPSQYESIARFLGAGPFDNIIDKVNYYQNKLVIDRLSNILAASRRLGLGVSLILAIIAILVTFNTIRLAIFTNRDEISVMRLVGASNSQIQGPFIVEGMLYGLFAAVITMIIFYPLMLWLGPEVEHFFGGLNLFQYYISHWPQIFAILLLVGIALGTFSSWVAVRRYLKI